MPPHNYKYSSHVQEAGNHNGLNIICNQERNLLVCGPTRIVKTQAKAKLRITQHTENDKSIVQGIIGIWYHSMYLEG